MTGLGDLTTVVTTMLEMGTTFVGWCCTTFPINIAVAGGALRIVLGVVRKAKKVVG